MSDQFTGRLIGCIAIAVLANPVICCRRWLILAVSGRLKVALGHTQLVAGAILFSSPRRVRRRATGFRSPHICAKVVVGFGPRNVVLILPDLGVALVIDSRLGRTERRSVSAQHFYLGKP